MQDGEWSRTENNFQKQDNGCLLLDNPEPSFLADFNHKVKTIGKTFCELAVLSKKESVVSKEVAARIKTYRGAMLKQIRYLKWEEDSKK